jgi:low temperature requirement protein LtrA
MSEPVSRPLPGVRRMSGRDPGEAHRASTPLELLFDLTFVVAVARAASQLDHALADGQVGQPARVGSMKPTSTLILG